MKEYFLDVVRIIENAIGREKFTAWFSAENLDFARFSQAKIRQAGTIEQQFLQLDLIEGLRHASASIGLSRDLARDKEVIDAQIKRLREQIARSEEDPFLMIHEGDHSTESITNGESFDKEEIVNCILKCASNLDLVGCYFGGPIFKGFANSYGQANWFEKSSFVVDTSIYHSGDKAIKQSYADTCFSASAFGQKIEEARLGLKLFDQEAKTISPGSYRVYFSPSAVQEIIGMLNWGGFSRQSLEVKNSPLLPLWSGQKTLSNKFSLNENIECGVGPNFQSQGFMKPQILSIIEDGRLKNTMISPKTAKEYQIDHNGADDDEALCAIDMKAGSLLKKDILTTLGDGLYINNLWYLNFSDRQKGCLTGMTRFLCFVVKDGRAIAPFSPMRFDDSIYRIFGDNLAHVTKEREMLIDTSTYDERSTSCSTLPGIIAEDVRFTL